MSHRLKVDKEYEAHLEDNFLKHIGYEHVENLCNELDEDREQWRDIEIPESMNQWFDDFKKKEKKKKNRGIVFVKYAKRAAVLLICLLGVNFFLYTNVEAYRIRLLDTFVDIKESFTQLDMVRVEPEYRYDLPDDWMGIYLPSFIPEGYQVSDSWSNASFARIKYTDKEGNVIIYHQLGAQTSIQIDSEKGTVDKIEVSGEEAYLMTKENLKIISWLKDDKVFQIEAKNIDAKSIIKMAESVQIIDQ